MVPVLHVITERPAQETYLLQAKSVLELPHYMYKIIWEKNPLIYLEITT